MKYTIVILLIVLMGCTTSATNSTGAMSSYTGQDQVVKVSLRPQGYVFTPGKVKVGEPVVLRNDGSVQGCAMFMKQVDLGINANFMKNNDYVFVPQKTGAFRVSCNMGMYFGQLEVVE